MLFSFRLAIFLGAGLLFLIQPLFAKMVLPMLGGSPGVWNVCMLFFQGMLLAGYAYAHLSHRFLGGKGQVLLHLFVLTAVLFLPPIAMSHQWSPPEKETPIFWLLALLFSVVGAPFFAVSATSPLLQQWFAQTQHQRSTNPYFLYSASNAGSIVALLAYPFLIERILAVDSQAYLWRGIYIGFFVSMVVCAFLVLKSKGSLVRPDRETLGAEEDAVVNWKQRSLWISLAFVPSSWMLGVTSFLTTDISPIPILWIIPLSLYLITFIIAFADRPILSRDWLLRLFPIAMLILVATTLFKGGMLLMGLHLVFFFLGAMSCHFELARQKPKAHHLTEFYFWIAVGGLLGGVFNGLLAPMVFPWILEYPITLMIACMLCPTFEPNAQARSQLFPLPSNGNPQGKKKKRKNKTNENWHDPLASKIKLGTFVFFVLALALLANTLEFQGTVVLVLTTIIGLAALCICFFLNRPVWFALPLGVVLIVAKLEPPQSGEKVLYTGRGFFGVNRVVAGPQGSQIRLYHGATVHGIQNAAPGRPEIHDQPTSYYHRTGPLGMIFQQAQKIKPLEHVGIVGLGAGTAVTYLQSGQRFTFFEIDAIVKQIAENPDYFSFLQKAGAENYDIVLGDGRLKISQEKIGSFDMLVFDAFSSDAIPIHLLTKQAVELYASKLSDDGLMAFHISNLHFDLEPILGDIAFSLGFETVTCHDREISDDEMMEGKAAASYVVIAKDLDRSGLSNHVKWKRTRRTQHGQPWTDDFSNVFDAFKQ
ncbi:MAG: fused MFS/spermidine synthase [Planctomycetota bacterium]|nr:fused MFS/spermidine synthase [Planctomycetota bacterium]